MLLNCARRTALMPEYVNTASGLDLHRFNWLEIEEISALHYTSGGPWFLDYAHCGYANDWPREAAFL